jgi:hypothetical protein
MTGYLGTHAVFEVTEGYIGMDGRPKQVEIRTGMGGTDCGYPFKPGLSYLVYAREDKDGLLVTDTCSRTAVADQAEADLTFLRGLKSGARGAYVSELLVTAKARHTMIAPREPRFPMAWRELKFR